MTNLKLSGRRIVKADAHIARTTADASCSAHYKHLQTSEVIQVFERHGFEVSKSWAKGRAATSKKEVDTSKHVVEMHQSNGVTMELGNLVPTVYIVNSHDGSSGLSVKLGFLRLVCMNGLVVGTELGSFTVRHAGKAAQMSELEAKIAVMAESFKEILCVFNNMQRRQLTEDEQKALAVEALKIKYTEAVINKMEEAALNKATAELLKSHRLQDNGADLFVTFNRIQENMLQVSLTGRKAAIRAEDKKLSLTASLVKAATSLLAA